MEKYRENEMYLTHCCKCGRQVSRSAPGTLSVMTCPKCGSELKVKVDGHAVMVTLLNFKEPVKSAMAY